MAKSKNGRMNISTSRQSKHEEFPDERDGWDDKKWDQLHAVAGLMALLDRCTADTAFTDPALNFIHAVLLDAFSEDLDTAGFDQGLTLKL